MSQNFPKPLIDVQNLYFSYASEGQKPVPILFDMSFQIFPGEFVAIQGPSGSGKSTLLYLLGCMSPLQRGRLIMGGVDITQLTDDELAVFRNENLGFIFQQFHLLPKANVFENILLAARYPIENAKNLDSARGRVALLAERLGLKERLHHGPQELSGGQQQRVAIARALTQRPELLLADEPVASLDPATCHTVMDYLKKVNQELGITIICNLHFLSLVRQYATRVIALKGGEIVFEGSPSEISDAWFEKIYGEGAKEVHIN